MRLRKKYPKILLIGTGVAFIVGGIDCIENDLLVVGYASFLAASLNLAGSFFMKKHPFVVNIFLLFINAIFAFLSCYVFIQAGRDKIQYGWAAVGIVSLFMIIRAFIKRAKAEKMDVIDERDISSRELSD